MTLSQQHKLAAIRNYAKLEALRDGINALGQYLESEKFQGDGNQWVSTADVMMRLREMASAQYEAGEAAIHPYVTCGKCGCNEIRHGSYREYGVTKHYCNGQHGNNCKGCDGFVPMADLASMEVAA